MMIQVFVLALALCTPFFGADWPTFGHDPQRSGWAFEKALYNSGRAMTSWVHFSGLAAADGCEYAALLNQELFSARKEQILIQSKQSKTEGDRRE